MQWQLRTYDVWGNARDGWEVNDIYGSGIVELPAEPTDKQIKRALGLRCNIDTDGDDKYITINRARDGYPLAELCQID